MISTVLQMIRVLGVLRTELIWSKGRRSGKTWRKVRKAEIEKGDLRFRANVNRHLWVRQSRKCSGNMRAQFYQSSDDIWRNSKTEDCGMWEGTLKARRQSPAPPAHAYIVTLSGSSVKLTSLNDHLKACSYTKRSILITKVFLSFCSYCYCLRSTIYDIFPD